MKELLILVSICAIVCNLIIALKFSEIASMKGHGNGYFWYCFFFGLIGALMVVALPDKNLYQVSNKISQGVQENNNSINSNRQDSIVSAAKFTDTVHAKSNNETQQNKVAKVMQSSNITIHIDKNLCIGCSMCAKVCPNDAIEGNIRQVHMINDNCVECGLCMAACSVGAIKG